MAHGAALALALTALAPSTLLAQSGRSTPVNVVNFPAVQSVEEVNNPAFQPYQGTNSRVDTISVAGVTLLSTAIELEPVPAGKRVVVQHLSFRASGEDILHISCSARVRIGFDQIVLHPLPLVADEFRTEEVFRVTVPITMYADPDQRIGVSCSIRTTDDVFLQVGVSGYQIDL